jgi:hypothetical protein
VKAGHADYLGTHLDVPSGVYVVHIAADIVGWGENVAWLFADESLADLVVKILERRFGAGRAWQTYEPIAYSRDDPDFRTWLIDRVAPTWTS